MHACTTPRLAQMLNTIHNLPLWTRACLNYVMVTACSGSDYKAQSILIDP